MNFRTKRENGRQYLRKRKGVTNESKIQERNI